MGAGRKPTTFTDRQVDRATQLLGRATCRSRASAALARQYKLGKHTAYALLDVAQERVFERLRTEGRATDPLTATYLFLESVVADQRVPMRHRINASLGIIRLLGLARLARQVRELSAADSDAVLAAIQERRQARQAAPAEPG